MGSMEGWRISDRDQSRDVGWCEVRSPRAFIEWRMLSAPEETFESDLAPISWIPK